jgi:hypothetical protein
LKTLLAHIYNYFEFLYLNPRYRITDSSTGGTATSDATLRFTGPQASFWFSNERGRIYCDVAPTRNATRENWFRISIVRQYIDGLDEASAMPQKETAEWVRNHIGRIEALFSDETAARSCQALSDLERLSAQKRFGPA